MKQLVFLLSFLFFTISVKAQYFSGGTDPSSVKWRYIQTEHYKIIFPEDYELQANVIANKMEYALRLVSDDFDLKPKRLPLIIHTQTVTPNAFVAWAPKRMELFATPGQDQYAQDWFSQLAIHENKHYCQFDLLQKKSPLLLKVFLGQQLAPLMTSLFIPLWYMEGDAVVAETALSESGRGRQPEFTKILKAQTLDKKIYSYNKALFGSYKQYTPSVYELGYELAGIARLKFGDNVWKQAIERTGRTPLVLNFETKNENRYKQLIPGLIGITRSKQNFKISSGFNSVFLEKGNQKLSQWYKKALSISRERWHEQIANTINYDQIVSPEKGKHDINYRHPKLVQDNQIFAVKSSLVERAHFVIIDSTGNERKIYEPGTFYNYHISANQNKICWAEQKSDPRWSHRSYSIINLLDIETGKRKELGKKTKYFAPAISPDGSMIATIEVNTLYEKFLVLIDAFYGEAEENIPSPDGMMLQHPSWSSDNQTVFLIGVGENFKQLLSYNRDTKTFKSIGPKTHVDIKHPVYHNGWLYFTGAFNARDNIYRINIETEILEQVTNTRYAADYANMSHDGKLYFSDYKANGYQLIKLDLKNLNPNSVDFMNATPFYTADALAKTFDEKYEADQIPNKVYTSKKYSKLGNLVNIHSWAPFVPKVSTQDFSPGVSFQTQNHLSTMNAVVGVEYDPNLIIPRFYTQIQYTGFYPVFGIKASTGLMNTPLSFKDLQGRSYNKNAISFNTSIPLSYTNGNKILSIRPGAEISYSNYDTYPNDAIKVEEENIGIIRFNFLIQNIQRRSARDLYPRHGQVFYVNFTKSILNNDLKDYIFSSTGILYLPGVAKHHSLRFQLSHELGGNQGFFLNQLAYARGYNIPDNTKILTYKMDYSLPLLYPDLDLGFLGYVKRIQMNLFFDYSIAEIEKEWKHYQSIGGDILFDMHFFRYPAPFQVGMRFVKPLDGDSIIPLPIIQLNLYGI